MSIKQNSVANNWTKTRPTEPGKYWFYGYAFLIETPRLFYVEVFQSGSQSLSFVTEGAFLYKAIGKWLKVTLPEMPELNIQNPGEV